MINRYSITATVLTIITVVMACIFAARSARSAEPDWMLVAKGIGGPVVIGPIASEVECQRIWNVMHKDDWVGTTPWRDSRDYYGRDYICVAYRAK